MALLLAAGCSGSRATIAATKPTASTGTTAAASTTMTASATTTTAAAQRWPERSLDIADVWAVAAVGPTLYAQIGPGPTSEDTSVLARVDTRTGARLAVSALLTGVHEWVAATRGLDLVTVGNGQATLITLDPATLRQTASRVLAHSGTDVSAALARADKGGLWVAEGTRLYDPDGRVVELPAEGTSVAVTPDGNGVYVGLNIGGGDVDLYNATTGRLEATHAIPDAIAGVAVTATTTAGAWVTFRTGRENEIRASGLHPCR